MIFREPLPPDCPPSHAQDILEPILRYRLLADAIPAQSDFDSWTQQHAGSGIMLEVDPCVQSGVSVFTTVEAARRRLNSPGNRQKNGKRRWNHIGVVTIEAGAGKATRVGSNGHQTWWPTSDFDPVEHCEMLP